MNKSVGWKSRCVSVLKLAIVAGAIFYLISTGKLDFNKIRVASSGVPYLVAGAGASLVLIFISYLRYYLLLVGVGAQLPLLSVVRIGMIGSFFNTFMFGGVGGDVIKLAYVMRETGKRAETLASVMVDRVLGLLGLLSLGAIALFISWNEVVATPSLHGLALAVFGVVGTSALCAVCGFIALAMGRRKTLVLWIATTALLLGFALFSSRDDQLAFYGAAMPEALLRGRALLILGVGTLAALAVAVVMPSCLPGHRLHDLLDTKVPGGSMLLRLIESLLIYREHLGIITGAYVLSMVLQGLALVSLFCFGQALTLDPSPQLSHIFFAGPPSFIANAMPLPGGGLGVGEAALENILGYCRGPDGAPVTGGASIFLVQRFWLIIWGLLGLPVYLMGRKDVQDAQRQYEDGEQAQAAATELDAAAEMEAEKAARESE